MIRPVDLSDDDLWNMYQACASGDLQQVRSLVARRPALVASQYDYTAPLHFAVREGHLPVVRFLLEQGASPHYQTHPFRDSLLTMAKDREYHELAQFLLETAAQQFPVREGVEVFFGAACRGDLAEVQSALAHDPELARVSNDTGETALHQAAAGGHLPVMKVLLDAGANPDAIRSDGHRPIHRALDQRGRDPLHAGVLAGYLLGRGAAYNVYLAAAIGDHDFVREALARDPALANFEDTAHRRPISAAAWRDDLETVRMLLDHGANPSLPEEGAPQGQALWTAVYYNRPQMVRLLLERGANPNTSPESSGSALGHARKYPELQRMLLEYGAHDEVSDGRKLETLITDHDSATVEKMLEANPDLVGDPMKFWGEGILAVPANHGNHPMIELLLRYGARVPDVCKWGPQYYFKHTATAVLLLERGMNPNQANWQRFSLLHYFSAAGHLDKVRLLLDHGAEINAVDEEYRSTPLGCAARWGQREIVRVLLERGADPLHAGAPWSTPIAWARKKGHTEIESDLRLGNFL